MHFCLVGIIISNKYFINLYLFFVCGPAKGWARWSETTAPTIINYSLLNFSMLYEKENFILRMRIYWHACCFAYHGANFFLCL